MRCRQEPHIPEHRPASAEEGRAEEQAGDEEHAPDHLPRDQLRGAFAPPEEQPGPVAGLRPALLAAPALLPRLARLARRAFARSHDLSLAHKVSAKRQLHHIVEVYVHPSTISGRMRGRLRVRLERKLERSLRIAFFSSPQSVMRWFAVRCRVRLTTSTDSSTRPLVP